MNERTITHLKETAEAIANERRRCLLIVEDVSAHGRFLLSAEVALARVHGQISKGEPA